MGRKYLGDGFDIHGGGMDLIFPHHECEIAQAVAAEGKEIVPIWMHNNMITIKGQKMGKSLGNFITLEQFFSGDHQLLDQAYSPMVIRFFILQAHYRSTVDFSNEALQASSKGMERMMDAYAALGSIKTIEIETEALPDYTGNCYAALNDDLNSPKVIAELFDATRRINQAKNGENGLTAEQVSTLKELFDTFFFDILGMKQMGAGESSAHLEAFGKAMDLLLEIRQGAKAAKDWATSDKIRDELKKIGFEIMDGKDGSSWKL